MINYSKGNATTRTASGKRKPTEGYGDLPLTFLSSSGEVSLFVRDVAVNNGQTCTGKQDGVTVKFKTGQGEDLKTGIWNL